MLVAVAVALFLIGVLAWWFSGTVPSEPEIAKEEKRNATPPPPAAAPASTALSPGPAEGARIIEQAEANSAAYHAAFKQPINFYGRVLDENETPIAGASAQGFVLIRPDTKNNSEEHHTTSAADGSFSLTGLRGLSIRVNVAREGYYSIPSKSHALFAHDPSTSVGERSMPTAESPALFYLRKKGEPAALIKKSTRSIMLARDGAPAEMSFATGKQVPVGQGDLRVEYWRQPGAGQRYDWKCRVSVPGGGLIERGDQFDFQAPDAGYQPAVEIDRPATLEQQWSSGARQEYFAKTKEGNFARLQLRIIGGDQPYFVVDSFLNPADSPNLEYDENLQASAPQP